MHIASPNIVDIHSPSVMSPSPNGTHQVADLVSPSRLFELAATRFDAALATSRIGGPETAPSAIVTVMALEQAEAGLRTLKSVIVPSTPFYVRTRAALAIDAATEGIELLRRYHGSVVGRGDGAHRVDSLPIASIRLLEEGRLQLGSAIAIARQS